MIIDLLFILISILLILACGVFVAAEFSLVTVSRARVERLTNSGDKGAAGVLAALRSLSTQLSGAQIGITITNLAIGLLAQPAIADLLRGPLEDVGLKGPVVTSVSVAIAIGLATALTMVFGELVPKNLAIAKPIETAKAVQGLQRGFTTLMHYPILFMNGTANKIVRRLGIEPQEELASARSVEELLSVVKHSARRGTLAKDTAVLIARSLEFNERHASDVMTPRVKIRTVAADAPVTSIIDAVKVSGFSRFPVIDAAIDNVIGIVHVKDAVAVPFEERGTVLVRSVMHEAEFAPSSIELDTLIERMRDEGTEAVITIDEFGGVDGLVTLEDLVEELVGEVKDEHDEKGKAVKKLGAHKWLVSGLLRPDEVGMEIDLALPEDEEFETIGGLVLNRLEEVPEVGDKIEVDGVTRDGKVQRVLLRVVQMDGRRIDRIELSLIKQKGQRA